jgi:hypothetical protein
MRTCCDVRRGQAAALIVLLLAVSRAAAQERLPVPPDQLVKQMEQAEAASRSDRQHFMYRNRERSTRTGGHLWDELVVEAKDGRMRRLLAVDGKPLSGAAESAEEKRISNLVSHPDEFRREAQALRDDEFRLSNILKQVPRLYVFKIDGSQGNCTGVAFEPNPQFQEQSFQDRILHAMSGVLLIDTRQMRLCGIDAHLDHNVEFGFGLLGKVSGESRFSVMREEIAPKQWKNTKISVHVDGKLLLLKSVARDEEATHNGFKPVPQDLTAAQAADLVRSASLQYASSGHANHP